MSIVNLFPGGLVTREQQDALYACDHAIVAAVMAARNAGVPQGLIVALLHGHAHAETARMLAS